MHEIIVGNIGTVYLGDSAQEAKDDYYAYKQKSEHEFGRASGESVVWLKDGEIVREHYGTIDQN